MNWKEQKQRRKDQGGGECKWGIKTQSLSGAVRMECKKLLWRCFRNRLRRAWRLSEVQG